MGWADKTSLGIAVILGQQCAAFPVRLK